MLAFLISSMRIFLIQSTFFSILVNSDAIYTNNVTLDQRTVLEWGVNFDQSQVNFKVTQYAVQEYGWLALGFGTSGNSTGNVTMCPGDAIIFNQSTLLISEWYLKTYNSNDFIKLDQKYLTNASYLRNGTTNLSTLYFTRSVNCNGSQYYKDIVADDTNGGATPLIFAYGDVWASGHMPFNANFKASRGVITGDPSTWYY